MDIGLRRMTGFYKKIIRIIFYRFYFPTIVWFSYFLPKKVRNKVLNFLIIQNNNFMIDEKNGKIEKILVLLPRCLQYFKCEHNIISSIENCKLCGRCKIKDIVNLKEKYNLDIKVAPGGNLAKYFVEEVRPDYVIAVACELELILGIKEVFPYKVLAVPNIIVEKPCINTDVEVENIEKFIKLLYE